MILGNFDSTDYDGLGKDKWLGLLCMFSTTFLGSIVLLNMLIAVMGDSYAAVM